MKRLLAWLRLTDDDGALSLTHVSLFLALYCMCRGVQVSWTEMGGFVVALASYRMKRWANDSTTDQSDTQAKVEELTKQVQKLSSPERLQQLQQAFQTRGPGAPR